ncbi:hypothetical protein [Aliikangiella sp. IMCC44359]|uniref:hypothetical protein n=1 Tax=Aliikangiella sp. IMCC44359 TaxID=3459125 RepID=UPI00403AA804
MKFAKFWEKTEVPVDKKFFGYSFFCLWGASNKSLENAKSHANSRAEQFKKLIKLNNHKIIDYEYGNGFIKEEVIDELKSEDEKVLAVISRNNYGALILNSEYVLFGDIDVNEGGLFSSVLALFGKVNKNKKYYIDKVEEFQKKNPKYSFRLYETFAGLRLVLLNNIVSSDEYLTNKIFSSLDIDPLYIRLCKNQSCFRARLTPKPWRIGFERPQTRFPRSDNKEKAEFKKWVSEYENLSKGYTTVKFINNFGAHAIHPDVEKVLAIHDQYSSVAGAKLA